MSSAQPLTAPDFKYPAILLSGPVDYDMYRDFRAKLEPPLAEIAMVRDGRSVRAGVWGR